MLNRSTCFFFCVSSSLSVDSNNRYHCPLPVSLLKCCNLSLHVHRLLFNNRLFGRWTIYEELQVSTGRSTSGSVFSRICVIPQDVEKQSRDWLMVRAGAVGQSVLKQRVCVWSLTTSGLRWTSAAVIMLQVQEWMFKYKTQEPCWGHPHVF